MSRRRFLLGAMAAGLTAAGASALLAACDAGSSSSGGNNGKGLEGLFGLNTAGLAAQQRQWFHQITNDFHTLTSATGRWDTLNWTSEELPRIQSAIVSGGGPGVFTLCTTHWATAT